ncbi:MAG: heterodisulfide reductase-related iron-sulfur binding cluster, partial [Candidatus Latescibacterota bacterium]|nr:heterodisulfide reductase-related iron-sulfur binding cluster [Candidatus Latescibacterota bacterium]
PNDTGCCGALTFHMGERRQSRKLMGHMIEVWHREIEGDGLDAIVLNTSGCATAVREYEYLFRHDPTLAEKAKAVVERVRDVTEVVAELGLGEIGESSGLRIAYHDACSLQHGQDIKSEPRTLLQAAGFTVLEVPEGHICCGSAGTYNMLQSEMAEKLQKRKVEHIESVQPQVVAAGNIGCMEQIGRAAGVPIVHTVQLLDWATGGPRPVNLQTV